MACHLDYVHPFGVIQARLTPSGVAEILLPRPGEPSAIHVETNDSPLAKKLSKALERYFAGRREQFRKIPLDLDKGTPFQRKVWLAAREIPWGGTVTYGQLARAVGCGSARAVGQALGANPVPIIVPCHRILAAGGNLGGFSGGLDWKRTLLRIENVEFKDPLSAAK